jgi:predicted PurR-regulated permease PerM
MPVEAQSGRSDGAIVYGLPSRHLRILGYGACFTEANSAPMTENGRPKSSLAVQALLVLSVAYTLFLAADFFIPVVAAIILNLLLMPLVRLFERIHVPPPVSAALIVAAFVGVLATGFASLSGPISDWTARMPEITEDLEYKLRALREPVERVQEASKQVEEATQVQDPAEPTVKLRTPGLLDRLFSSLQKIGIQLTAMMVLLYFMLAVGNLFTEKLVRAMPRLSDKKRALTITRQVEHDVSRYLATTTLINIGFGVVVGVGLHAIGLPNAYVWGIAAAILNFVPYFGAIAGMAIVFVVALLHYQTMGEALLAPGVYLVANVLESQFLTPAVLSRRLTLNPVVLFLAVAFWGFIWGVPGALMAVPLLVAFKALCDHIERLAAIGDFLGGRNSNGKSNGTTE